MTTPIAPALDLSRCAREQVHLIGSVQPFGALLAFRPDTLTPVAGANTGRILGVPLAALEGRSVDSLLAADDRETFRNVVNGLPPEHPVTLTVTADGGADAVRCCITLYRANPFVIAEFEPATHEGGIGDVDAALIAASASLERAESTHDLLNNATSHIARLTGYDRVMVYRFAPDWSGEVVAETRDPSMEPYLGLHYPASDIPTQARNLFLRNRLRAIIETGATPAPIEGIGGPLPGPIDLSLSWIRQPSATHVQYMVNMGVVSSLVMSIVREGALWGLIACHHRTPRRPAPRLRAACVLVSQMLALQMPQKQRAEERDEALRLRLTLDSILERAARAPDLASALTAERPHLLDLVDSRGAAFILGDAVTLLGETPPRDTVLEIASWLERAAETPEYATDHLGSVCPEASACAAVASGLLASRLSQRHRDFILWFRPEANREVLWAGDPERAAEVSEDGLTVSPRRSFAAWKRATRGLSTPWRSAEINAARDLASGVREILMHRASEWARLNAELAAANRDLRSALAALADGRARVEAASDSLSLIFWVVDENDVCIAQSRQCLAYWGDLEGRHIAEDDLDPLIRERIAGLHRRAATGEIVREEAPEGAWGQPASVEIIAAPVRCAGEYKGTIGIALDITRRKRVEARQRMMAAELDHRVRNNLAVVISLINQSMSDSLTLRDFVDTINGRIRALARAHSLLSSAAFSGVGLRALMGLVLEPYLLCEHPPISLAGEDFHLGADAVTPLVFAMHELANNSSKYGALSTSRGRVSIRWWAEQRDAQRTLHLRWEEAGGPVVTPPTRSGMGSSIIEGLIVHEAGGASTISFHPTGVVCDIRIPMRSAAPPS